MDVVQLTKTFTRAAEVTMITSAQSDETFDYQATAELFTGKNIRVRSRVLKYVRFNHAADAIRFAIEQLVACMTGQNILSAALPKWPEH
jgi:hypothetical protein